MTDFQEGDTVMLDPGALCDSAGEPIYDRPREARVIGEPVGDAYDYRIMIGVPPAPSLAIDVHADDITPA